LAEVEAFMQLKLILNILIVALFNLFIPVMTMGQSAGTSTTDANFSLSQSSEDRTQFNLIIYESEEQSVSGLFSIQQLKILQAIMSEAEKFSLTQEGAGTDKPNTIRFYDKQERAFIVDVQKLGTRSEFFFTLETEIGRLTVNAGAINRSNKREEGFFFRLLDKVEAEIAKLSRQSPK
jgi:hypothetical protein